MNLTIAVAFVFILFDIAQTICFVFFPKSIASKTIQNFINSI